MILYGSYSVYITPGSFSQSGVNEWLALVAGIPGYEGPQWVIVGFSGGRWQVLSLLNSIAQEADDSINFEDFASDWDELHSNNPVGPRMLKAALHGHFGLELLPQPPTLTHRRQRFRAGCEGR